MRKIFTVGQEVKNSIEEKGFILKKRYDTSPEFNVLFLASKKKNRNGRLLITDSNDILRYELEVRIEPGFSNQLLHYGPELVIEAIVEERGRILVTRYLRSKYKKLEWHEWMKLISADKDGNYLLKVIQTLSNNVPENGRMPNFRRITNQTIALTTREKVIINVNGVDKQILIERNVRPQMMKEGFDELGFVGIDISYHLKIVYCNGYRERFRALAWISTKNSDMSYPNIKKVLPDLISLAQNTIATQEKIKNIK